MDGTSVVGTRSGAYFGVRLHEFWLCFTNGISRSVMLASYVYAFFIDSNFRGT
jgi:hypothetical protein